MPLVARRSALLVIAMVAIACTINVQNVRRPVSSETIASFGTLRSDLREVGFGGGTIDVLGTARSSGASATLTVAGLLPNGGDATAIDRGTELVWEGPTTEGVMNLLVAYRGPASESLWLQSLDLEVSQTCAIDVETADADVSVVDVAADVRVRTTSARIIVHGATSADLASENGEIDLDVTGPVLVTNGSGSVHGTLRSSGGSITCGSGAIRVDLVDLTDDLELTVEEGALVVRVSPDASLELDVMSAGGGVHIAVGDVVFDGTGSVVRTLGAPGGPRVIARAHSGAIRIEGL